MPLEFLKRKGHAEVELAPAQVVPEDASAQEYILKLYYAGKSTEGVRLKAGPRALAELPSMLVGLAQTEIEVVEPLPIEYSEAAPTIIRSSEAMQWVNAHHGHGPITRHALFVLESIDAIDLAFDTLAVALLDGELDTSGYPEYSAVVGGVASHWDEGTGDMLVRAVVGWGGRGRPRRHRPDRARGPSPGSSRTSSRTSTHSGSRLPIGRFPPPAGVGWSAPTAALPRPTSGRSTARSAACACCAAERSERLPCPSTTTSAAAAATASRSSTA